MFNYIRIELRRAFKGQKMLIALAIGCVVAVAQIIVDIFPYMKYLRSDVYNSFPMTVFQKCMCLINGSMFPVYYYMYMPILAAIPYATTLYKDRKSGYTKQIFTRIKKSNYYVAQYIAAFLSAGIIAVIPQIINVMIIALILPSIQPYVGIGYVGVFDDAIFSEIYYKSSYTYILLYMIIDFVFYGVLNMLALSVSIFANGRFSVIMSSFIIFEVIELIMDLSGHAALEPSSFVRAAQPNYGTTIWEILLLITLLAAISVIAIIYNIKRGDVYD